MPTVISSRIAHSHKAAMRSALLKPCLFALVASALLTGPMTTLANASGGATDRFACATPLGSAEITFNDSAGVIVYVNREEFYPDFGNTGNGQVTYVMAIDQNVWSFERTLQDTLQFSQNGEAAVPCQMLAQQPGFEINEGGMVSAIGNYSLGGNVRSGPGMEFDTIDSLPLGEPVSLVSRSGVQMDGYEWFEIEYSEGLRGYQWGGIMCSNALHIIGLYDPCPPEVGQQ